MKNMLNYHNSSRVFYHIYSTNFLDNINMKLMFVLLHHII